MITQLGQATRTLSGSRGDFFATVNNLEQFTKTLDQENSQVQLAQQQLSQVFGFLSGDRNELAGALNELATALGQVKYFIANNRQLLTSNVTKLASITKMLPPFALTYDPTNVPVLNEVLIKLGLTSAGGGYYNSNDLEQP